MDQVSLSQQKRKKESVKKIKFGNLVEVVSKQKGEYGIALAGKLGLVVEIKDEYCALVELVGVSKKIYLYLEDLEIIS